MDVRVAWPDAGVSRVPYTVYFDPAVYEREQERIFRGPAWHFVALEAEVPEPGDWRTSAIGDAPVIVARDCDSQLHVLLNRCAHKGALVCFGEAGRDDGFICAYHNWSYGLDGTLKSVAFGRGVGGRGGMAADFDPARHPLTRLRVATLHGLVFATFSKTVAPIEAYLGPEMMPNLARVFARPLVVLGRHSQVMNNNWKLYMENTRDSYHASLLHLFHTTFGVVRLTWAGGVRMSADGWHHLSYTEQSQIADDDDYRRDGMRSMRDDYMLADASLLDAWWEHGDRVTNAIQTVFPTLTVQQILNTLAVRRLVPRGPGKCELAWTVFGYADDSVEQTRQRIRQCNLIGPGGFISMEDACVGRLIQRASGRERDDATVIAMGGHDVASIEGSRATETSVRGFWKAYRELMDG